MSAMNPTEIATFSCPYCMAHNSVEIDLSCDLEQQLTLDCQTCCQPITLDVGMVEGQLQLNAGQENS